MKHLLLKLYSGHHAFFLGYAPPQGAHTDFGIRTRKLAFFARGNRKQAARNSLDLKRSRHIQKEMEEKHLSIQEKIRDDLVKKQEEEK